MDESAPTPESRADRFRLAWLSARRRAGEAAYEADVWRRLAKGLPVREEWRVVGEPGEGYPSYCYTFDSEEQARGFARLSDDGKPWDDGPHVERRYVTETPWRRTKT